MANPRRRIKVCRLVPFVWIAVSLLLVLAAIGAGFLGADPDQRWGPIRLGILALGLGGLGFLLLILLVNEIDRWLLLREGSPESLQRAESLRLYNVFANPWTSAESVEPQTKIPVQDVAIPLEQVDPLAPGTTDSTAPSSKSWRWESIFVVLFVIVVIAVLYVGLISVWHYTWWPNITSYYDMLADAFTHLQVALLVEPTPELADLANPYPTVNRVGVDVIGDASYYDGKYYLYWGPAPAAVAALWKLVVPGPVGDEWILFVAASAIFLFSALILLHIRQKHFPSLPRWLLFVGVLAVGTTHPLLWMINFPSIHEAAISSGQAFLIAGLYFALPVLDGTDRRLWRLVLSASLWVLALGTRAVLMGAVGVFVIGLAISFFHGARRRFDRRNAATWFAALLLPLLIGGGLLTYYNYIRFDNVLESGLRYQFAMNDIGKLMDQGLLFNPRYFLPNVLYYIFAPLQEHTVFPFVRSVYGEYATFSAFLARFNLPDIYHIEDVIGLVFAVPMVVFSGYLAWALVCGWQAYGRGFKQPVAVDPISAPRRLRYTSGIILLAAIAAFLPSIMFFWVSNRYMLDSAILLAITAVVGAWLLYVSSEGFPARKTLVILLIVVALAATVLIGFLLGLTGPDARFDDLNPELYEQVIGFFSRSP